MPQSNYEYAKSIKSTASDELINTHVIRPVAGIIVRVMYKTPITPNQVTVASTIAGLAAAVAYGSGSPQAIAVAGLLISLKDTLDSVDGQLARAKNLYSRIGRFLDSIGDFIVNGAVFAAIGFTLTANHGNGWYVILSLLGLAGITFRVSYHVFYQSCFLHGVGKYENNRITEEIRKEDLESDVTTLTLQRIFQAMYGWQDRLVFRIDRWCRRGVEKTESQLVWYSDNVALRLSGFLGMGTELFLLTACSLLNELELYLLLNVVLMNLLLMGNVAYRRFWLSEKLTDAPGITSS